jgi:glycosyltransferase involved in cell wall biosynthesis
VRIPNVIRQRWWYESGIRRLADREQADVLLMPANLSARRGRIPQVVAMLDVNFLTQPATYESAASRYLSWSFRRAVRDADALITISEFSRSEISHHLGADPNDIEVVYPGLDEPLTASSSSSPLDGPYALWVGATEVSKNVGLLLDAWSAGAPCGLSLAIVGPPGRDHPTLVERASRLGDQIVIRGAVDEPELERWYRHAAVFLFPSRTEGFGFPPLEAMARDVPVIAARAGSLPVVLGDAALFHDPDDPETVRAHIERLMQDENLRQEQVVRGRDRAARYRWDRAGAATAALLRATAAAARKGGT